MALNQLFIFPFEKVRQGSRIVIYGIGNVGNSYLNQIFATGYCEVAAVLDKNFDKESGLRYQAQDVSKIKNLTYDYIVLAVNSEGNANRIKYDLVTIYGVDENKIIFAANRRIPLQVSIRSFEYIMGGHDFFRNTITEFLRLNYGQTDYFTFIIKEIEARDWEKKKEIIDYFNRYLEWEVNPVYRLVCLRILHRADLFSKNNMDIYMDCIEQIDCSNESKLWLLYDVAVMEKNNQLLRTRDFYMRKRSLIKKVVWDLAGINGDKKDRERKVSLSNRVAIVTFGLRGKDSSHNGLIVPYANEMVHQGKQVVIFPCDLFRYRYGECILEPIEIIEQDSGFFREEHRELFDPSIKVQYVEGDTIKERISAFINEIEKYSPSVVYDFCGEYAFLSSLYHKWYTTVSLPMRGYASSGCFDRYVGRNRTLCLKENKKYPFLENEIQLEEGLVCSVPVAAKRKHTRQEYGIDKEAFVITTVGARLQSELTKDFVDTVCCFLEKHTDGVWILVGPKICEYILSTYRGLLNQERIMFWGYETDLAGFYEICDIYWNPDRMGAGGSIATAMRCGLPIVTTDFPSDVLPRLGVENAIHGDYMDCLECVEKLYEDKEYRSMQGKKMMERMKISTVAEYVENLLHIGERAYRERNMMK